MITQIGNSKGNHFKNFLRADTSRTSYFSCSGNGAEWNQLGRQVEKSFETDFSSFPTTTQ